jgi:hypothetical protein
VVGTIQTCLNEPPAAPANREAVVQDEPHQEAVPEIQAATVIGVHINAVEEYDPLPQSVAASTDYPQSGVTGVPDAATEMPPEQADAYMPLAPSATTDLEYSALALPDSTMSSPDDKGSDMIQHDVSQDALQEYGSVVLAGQVSSQDYMALPINSQASVSNVSITLPSQIENVQPVASYSALDASSSITDITTVEDSSAAYGALPTCHQSTCQPPGGNTIAAIVTWKAPPGGGVDWNVHWQSACDLPTTTALQRAQRSVMQFSICQQFTLAAQRTVMALVDDLLKPKVERRLSSVNVGGIAGRAQQHVCRTE